jgi:hypothetical protein
MPETKHLAIVALMVAIAIVAYESSRMWWHYSNSRWYQRFLPVKIEVDSMIFSRRELNVRSDCGAAVFRLSLATTEAIERDGLAFFNHADARRPREIETKRLYTAWRETPFPKESGSGVEMPWQGLSCTKAYNAAFDPLIDQAYSAAHKPGSYFTTRGRDMLLVSPQKRMVVLPYW